MTSPSARPSSTSDHTLAFETCADVDAALAVTILDDDKGAASETTHGGDGQHEGIVAHGGDDSMLINSPATSEEFRRQ